MYEFLSAVATALLLAYFWVVAVRGRVLIQWVRNWCHGQISSVALRILIAFCYAVPFALVAEQTLQELYSTSPMGLPKLSDDPAEHVGIVVGAALSGLLVGLIDGFSKEA